MPALWRMASLTRGADVGSRTVVVTGASGYVGRHVVPQLKSLGAHVIAVDVRASSQMCADEQVITDILSERFDPAEAFSAAPNVCLHLAWRDGFNHGSSRHMSDLSGHYRFLIKMLDFGTTHLAVMGSMHEVGYWEGAIDENTPCQPQSLYGVAKDALRRALFLEQGRRGFVLQWLRGFYIYGDDRDSQSIFGKLYHAAHAGERTFPFTMGKNLYDFLTVQDLGRMIAATVMQDRVCGIINCCSGRPMSLAERVEGFIADNGLDISLEYGAYPDRPYDSPGVWGDPGKINQILGEAHAGE